MKTKDKRVDGIISINKDLFDELFLTELEKRLETDPMLTDGLVDLLSTNVFEPGDINLLCEGCHSTSTYTICKYGTY